MRMYKVLAVTVALLAQQECKAAQSLPEDIVNAPLAQSDYERALTTEDRYARLTVNVPDVLFWLGEGDALVYRRTTRGKQQFIFVDAGRGVRQPAFDQARLATALNRASHKHYRPENLPFDHFELADKGAKITFNIEHLRWSCDLVSDACTGAAMQPGDSQRSPYDDTPLAENDPDRTSASPDGKWLAYIRNYNLYLRSQDGLQDIQLTWDGSQADYYALFTLSWSPASTHLAAYRVRPGLQREVHYLESSPADQLEPKHSTMTYPKPGDAITLLQPVLFDVASRRAIAIDGAAFQNPYSPSAVQWWKDGRGFTFEFNQRGHQLYRLIEVDAATGQVRSLIDEVSKTFVDYQPLVMDQVNTGKTFRYDIDDGMEIIWASERDGNEHLYLFNGRTGELQNQITRGDWVVRAVYHIDPIKRQIWFGASGMHPGEDPYFVHAYRIDFDGKGLTALTPEPANHHIEFSPNGRYYVDLWSRIDVPPRMVLYRASDNTELMQVESAEIAELIAAGWQPPVSFNAKGRDGETDIWGVIHLPVDFDRNKRYRVVEHIYAGPTGSFVPKSFSASFEPLTQLGFIVVQIDGMGTNHRSRAFHDIAWKNLKDAGLPDRILWHKAASAKYSWYDVANVGIFGGSAGGQNAASALLFHPDFYKVRGRKQWLLRQPAGQDLVERTVDGLAGRDRIFAVLRHR